MKAILEFSLPEESTEFHDAVNGWKYKDKFEQIWEKLFRPFHKHGYNSGRINELLGTYTAEEQLTEAQKSCVELFELLEKEYCKINLED